MSSTGPIEPVHSELTPLERSRLYQAYTALSQQNAARQVSPTLTATAPQLSPLASNATPQLSSAFHPELMKDTFDHVNTPATAKPNPAQNQSQTTSSGAAPISTTLNVAATHGDPTVQRSAVHGLPEEGLAHLQTTQNAASQINTVNAAANLRASQAATAQVTGLIRRFSMVQMPYEALLTMPLSQLTPAQKTFVLYLQKNPQAFDRISRIEEAPQVLTPEDIQQINQLDATRQAQQTATQTTQQTNALNQPAANYYLAAPLPIPTTTVAPTTQNQQATPQQLQALINNLSAASGQPLTFDQLMAIRSPQADLSTEDTATLAFLQSPTVARMLQSIALPNQNVVDLQMMQILASILWNPSLRSTPILFYKTPVEIAEEEETEEDDEEITPVDNIDRIEAVEGDEDYPEAPKVQRPYLRLAAHDIAAILHNISPNGTATLAQIRQYQPHTPEESRVLNLLRQSAVFQLLAGLDDHPQTLSDDDIQLAMHEGSLFLSDPSMTLVVIP